MQEGFTRTKSTKHIQVKKNKKDTIFMHIKTSKRKKIACLTFFAFCAFYAFYAFYPHKKHLRGGKSLVYVLCFLCFLCVWNPLVKKKIIKRFKTALIPSFTILLPNALAVPVLIPTVGVLDWTLGEIKDIDIKTRKILALTRKIIRLDSWWN